MPQQLTIRQAVLWFVMYQIGSAFLLLPSSLAGIAGRDAWLSIIVSISLHLLLLPLYASIAKQMKGRSISAYLNDMLGNVTGAVLTSLFVLLVPFLIFIMTMKNLGEFITTSIAPDMPEDVIYALMSIAVFTAIRGGVQIIGRTAEILFFILPVLYLFVIVALLPYTRPDQLLPIAEYGWKPIVRASITLLAFPYLEVPLFLALVPYLKNAQAWRKAVLRSSLISGAMYLVMMAHVIAAVGGKVTANMTFASYIIVRMISIGNFIERFEIIIAIMWYISIFFRLTLLMFVSVREASLALRLKDENALLIPALLIAFVAAPSIWPNLTFLYEFFQQWPIYAMNFGIAAPALLWFIGRIKPRRQRVQTQE